MKVYDKLDDRIISFIEKQKMFFVASAPLSGDGHINLSPKGYDAFKVIDDTTVAWLDLGGSGIETQAHVQENGRITIMFCAPPTFCACSAPAKWSIHTTRNGMRCWHFSPASSGPAVCSKSNSTASRIAAAGACRSMSLKASGIS